MTRTTVTSVEDDALANERGKLKLFFSYASFTGATTALLDEVQGMVGRGKDVFLAELSDPESGKMVGQPFDVDQILKRSPDLVALDDFAAVNEAGSRNRYRYQDALELLHAGIDVYAVLRVSNLENESDRVAQITGHAPDVLVPDRLFYNAEAVEFVDIDPQALIERRQAKGRVSESHETLSRLRLLALRCISLYAASAGLRNSMFASATDAVLSQHDRVVALVNADESPASVLHEAARIAAAERMQILVVTVRHSGRSRTNGADESDQSLERLTEQVEALGFELTVLYGDDTAETVRNYLRVQGATDLVMSNRRTVRSFSALSLVQAPLVERICEGLEDVRVHMVASEAATPRLHQQLHQWHTALGDFRSIDIIMSIVAVAIATGVATVLRAIGFDEASGYLVFILACSLIAIYTKSYVPSGLGVVLSCIAALRITTAARVSGGPWAAFLTFLMMAAVLSVVTFAAVGMSRAADRARQREQHTQALFELSRSLVFARGKVEVVDLSLDALVRLFGRSCAFYTSDPFARSGTQRDHDRRPFVAKAAPNDLDTAQFERIVEQNIAHWVFVNGEIAGSGTDTNTTSSIRYIPLMSDNDVIGVVAISDHHPLTKADEGFLEMVVNQVSNALERQALSAEHLRDMRDLYVGGMRSIFMSRLVASTNQAAGTIAEISRMLQSVRNEDSIYRDVLEQAVGMESLRARILSNRLAPILSQPATSGGCDMRAVVAAAVEQCRQGRGSTVIELVPGDDVPEVAVDEALARVTTELVIEAVLVFAPIGGIVSVDVQERGDSVQVTISDDRPDPVAGQSPALASDYDQTRSQALLAHLGNRAEATSEGAECALARALGIPIAACVVDGRGDQRKIVRIDRIEYGLYIASLVINAHNGDIKMRHRLGGGMVTSFTLPIA